MAPGRTSGKRLPPVSALLCGNTCTVCKSVCCDPLSVLPKTVSTEAGVCNLTCDVWSCHDLAAAFIVQRLLSFGHVLLDDVQLSDLRGHETVVHSIQ